MRLLRACGPRNDDQKAPINPEVIPEEANEAGREPMARVPDTTYPLINPEIAGTAARPR